MANLASAPERARKVRGIEEAARHHANVDAELGLGSYTEEDAAKGEEALRILEDRFPGVRARAVDKVAYGGHTPALSRSAQRELDREPAAGEAQSPAAVRARAQQPAGARRRVSSATAIHARPRSRSRSRGAGLWRATGIPGGALSTAQLAMRTIGGVVGLSFLYLLLSPRGSRALELGGSGVTHSLAALISPNVDPLRATAKAAPARAAPAALAKGIGTVDQSGFLATPLHPLPATSTKVLPLPFAPGVTPVRVSPLPARAGQQPNVLQIGSNPLGAP